MEKFIYIFFILIAYKLLRNFTYWFECKMLNRSFVRFCEGKNINLFCKKHKFDSLMKNANVQDATFPTAAPIPGGKYAGYEASIFDAFPTKDPVGAALIIRKLEQAVGTYSDRIKECFSPFYWIELFIFLPRNCLNYLNIDKDKFAYKLCNICLTALWWLFIAAITLFDIGIKIHFGNFTLDTKQIFSNFPNIS